MALWEIDAAYDPAGRPGQATVVPVHPNFANPPAPSPGAGTGALHPLTILLNAAGALRRGADMMAPPPPPGAPVKIPAPGPEAPQPPAIPWGAEPPAMPGPSADVDRPVVAPPVNSDLFGRFIRGALDANPVTAGLPPEVKDRGASIFRLWADQAWRENSQVGTAVSNLESGVHESPEALRRLPAGSVGPHNIMMRKPIGQQSNYMDARPPEVQQNLAERYDRKKLAYDQNQAQKRDQMRALGQLSTGEQIGAVLSSIVGAALSPETAVGPGGAAYSTARTGGKVLQGAGINAAVVGATDPIAQTEAVARGDKREYSPAEHALATGGAAALGALIPALGALARRFGALKDAPAPSTRPPEASPEQPKIDTPPVNLPSEKVGQPAAPEAKPDLRYTEEGVPIIRITPEKKAEAPAPPAEKPAAKPDPVLQKMIDDSLERAGVKPVPAEAPKPATEPAIAEAPRAVEPAPKAAESAPADIPAVSPKADIPAVAETPKGERVRVTYQDGTVAEATKIGETKTHYQLRLENGGEIKPLKKLVRVEPMEAPAPRPELARAPEPSPKSVDKVDGPRESARVEVPRITEKEMADPGVRQAVEDYRAAYKDHYGPGGKATQPETRQKSADRLNVLDARARVQAEEARNFGKTSGDVQPTRAAEQPPDIPDFMRRPMPEKEKPVEAPAPKPAGPVREGRPFIPENDAYQAGDPFLNAQVRRNPAADAELARLDPNGKSVKWSGKDDDVTTYPQGPARSGVRGQLEDAGNRAWRGDKTVLWSQHTGIVENPTSIPDVPSVLFLSNGERRVLNPVKRDAPAQAAPEAPRVEPAAPKPAEGAVAERGEFVRVERDHYGREVKVYREEFKRSTPETEAAERAEFERKVAREKAEIDAEKPKPADLRGFDEGETKMAAGLLQKRLAVNVKNNGRVISRRALVEEIVEAGGTVGVGKDGSRRLIYKNGTSFLLEKDISKTGMDYASHLAAKRDAPKSTDATPAPKPAEPARVEAPKLEGGAAIRYLRKAAKGGDEKSKELIERFDMLRAKRDSLSERARGAEERVKTDPAVRQIGGLAFSKQEAAGLRRDGAATKKQIETTKKEIEAHALSMERSAQHKRDIAEAQARIRQREDDAFYEKDLLKRIQEKLDDDRKWLAHLPEEKIGWIEEKKLPYGRDRVISLAEKGLVERDAGFVKIAADPQKQKAKYEAELAAQRAEDDAADAALKAEREAKKHPLSTPPDKPTEMHAALGLTPAMAKSVGPELVGATVGGLVDHWETEGRFGFSPRGAIAGALAVAALRHRLPFLSKSIVGKSSYATDALAKGGDMLASTRAGRMFHPTMGIERDLWDKLVKLKVETRNFQDDALKIAKYIRENTTPQERIEISDWIERRDLAAHGINSWQQASAKVQGMADALSQHVDGLGKALEQVGMLDPAARAALQGEYLHRYYLPKLAADDGFKQKAARMKASASYALRRGESVEGVDAGSFAVGDTAVQWTHARSGVVEYHPPGHNPGPDFFSNKEWKVEAVDQGKMALHRDYTPQERQRMGEIRDANFRFAMGSMEASRDLALGKMFQDLASNPRWSSATDPGGWKKVPTDAVGAGSAIKKYGNLAGRWVSPETWDALKIVRKPWSPDELDGMAGVMNGYLKAMGIWKVGKTAYNPATHFNNVMGNVSLAALTGEVGPVHLMKAIGALKRGDPVIEEARRAGLSLNREANLGDTFDGVRVDVGLASGMDPRTGWTKFMDWYTNNMVVRAYQAEDSVFKLGAYMRRRAAGESPEEAVAGAHKVFFDYSDVPLGVQAVRDFYSPFFTYTYKYAQVMLREAAERPHRYLAAFGILSALDMMSYDWMYGDRAKAVSDYEREMAPKWLQGRSGFGAQKAIRLPANKPDEQTGENRGLFLNTRYLIPGGDILDFVANGDFGPSIYPQALGNTILGGNPLINLAMGLATGKDTFFGKPITPYPDTNLWDFGKRPAGEIAANWGAAIRFMANQALPPTLLAAPDKLGQGLTAEGVIPKGSQAAEFFGWTGTDFAGRQRSLARAVGSVLGVKIEDVAPDEAKKFREADLAKEVRTNLTNARNLHRNQSTTDTRKENAVESFKDRIQRFREETQKMRGLQEKAGPR